MREAVPYLQQYREMLKKHGSDVIIEIKNYTQHHKPFFVAKLEHFSLRSDGKFPPQRHSHHYFELVLKGQGSKTVGCNKFEIADNMLITVPARVVQSGTYCSEELSGYVLGFDLDFFLKKAFPRYLVENKGMLNNSASPYMSLTTLQASQLVCILEFLLTECEDGSVDPFENEFIPIKILEFLILCERYSKHVVPSGDTKLYNKLIVDFNRLIENNFMDQRTVNFYAAELNIHPNSLNAIVKFHSGHSAKSMINRRIADEAKYLLANTELSVKEIAGKLGFDDPNYFSYFFKRETDLSALEFKQTLFLKTA